MQSGRGWLSRSKVLKPVAPASALASAGADALTFLGS